MEQKTASRRHFNGKRPQSLGSCLTIFSRSLLLLLSVSIWVTGCGQGTTNNNYYDANKTPSSGSGAASNFGGGGATGDGGGGQGVLCGENKLYVRDLYEAILDKKRTMKTVHGPNPAETISPEAAKILASSIRDYFGPASSKLNFTTEKFWIDFINRISFLEDDRELYPSQDANSPIALQKGCSIVQIAYWDESPGNAKEERLYVSRKLWKQLDQLNKIGLLAHEYFFAQARKAGYKNSDAVRNQVGQLLSVEGLKPLFTGFVPSKDPKVKSVLPDNMNTYKYCEGTSDEDPNARLQFYQYRGSNNDHYFSFPVLVSSTINASYLQGTTVQVALDPAVFQTTELLVFQTELQEVPFHFLPQMDIPFGRWFNYSFSNLQSLLTGAGDQPVKWSGHLMASPTPIKISLINSVLEWNKLNKQTPRSRNELLSQTHEALKSSILNYCRVPAPEIEEALATLHNEINSAIQAGSYPTGFPKWNAKLANFSKHNSYIPGINHPAGPCNLNEIGQEYRSSDLPHYLYTLLLKTNTEDDGHKALGDSIYSSSKPERIPLGQMRVKQGNQELNFQLRCESYKTAYRELVTSKPDGESLTIIPNKIVRQASVLKENDFQPDEWNVTQKFINFLALKEGSREIEHLSELSSAHSPTEKLRQKLTNDHRRFAFDEQDKAAFYTELAREKNVTVQRCESPQFELIDFDSNSIKYRSSGCLVLTFEKSGNSYTTYFYYEHEPQKMEEKDLPQIEMVRILPTELVGAHEKMLRDRNF